MTLFVLVQIHPPSLWAFLSPISTLDMLCKHLQSSSAQNMTLSQLALFHGAVTALEVTDSTVVPLCKSLQYLLPFVLCEFCDEDHCELCAPVLLGLLQSHPAVAQATSTVLFAAERPGFAPALFSALKFTFPSAPSKCQNELKAFLSTVLTIDSVSPLLHDLLRTFQTAEPQRFSESLDQLI